MKFILLEIFAIGVIIWSWDMSNLKEIFCTEIDDFQRITVFFSLDIVWLDRECIRKANWMWMVQIKKRSCQLALKRYHKKILMSLPSSFYSILSINSKNKLIQNKVKSIKIKVKKTFYMKLSLSQDNFTAVSLRWPHFSPALLMLQNRKSFILSRINIAFAGQPSMCYPDAFIYQSHELRWQI